MKHDKYIWWGVVGLGVAVLLWYLTKQQIENKQTPQTAPVTTSYLVPKTLDTTNGASPTASTGLSEQNNIIGEHQNSTVANGTNPNNPANFAEFPGEFSQMPQLGVMVPQGVTNNVNAAQYFGSSQQS